jgi:hypothetical protein
MANEDREEMTTLVRACLADLTPPHREVLALQMQGLGNGDIAQALGIAPGTAGSRLHRAHEKLQAALSCRGYCTIPPGTRPPEGAVIIGEFCRGTLIHLSSEPHER